MTPEETNDTSDLIAWLRHIRSPYAGRAADALTRLSQRVADAENRASIAEEARSKLIEENLAQARRIEQQALEYVSLFDQCSEAQAKVAALESELAALANQEPCEWQFRVRVISTGEWSQWEHANDAVRKLHQDRDDPTVEFRPVFAHPPAAAASEDLSPRALYEDACIQANKNAADVERYRLWRRGVLMWPLTFSGIVNEALPAEARTGGTRIPSFDEWDAAIDAAIAAEKEQKA